MAPAPVGLRTCASRSSSADLPLIRNVMHLSAEGLADLARRVRSSAFETPLRPVAAIALMFAGRRPCALSCSRLECTSLSEKHRARSRRSTDCRRGGVGLRGAERRAVGALHASLRGEPEVRYASTERQLPVKLPPRDCNKSVLSAGAISVPCSAARRRAWMSCRSNSSQLLSPVCTAQPA